MKIVQFIFLIVMFCLISCSKDSNTSEYPKTFSFNHSEVTSEQGFVFKENESYDLISSHAGSLDSLRNNITGNLYSHIRDQMFGYYIESLTLLNKDSIEIKAWDNGQIVTYILPAFIDNPTGGIIDKNDFGTVMMYNKANGEIKFCFALALGIFESNGNPYYDLDYELCEFTNVFNELQNFIANNNYQKNDSLGIYMMDMVYKE